MRYFFVLLSISLSFFSCKKDNSTVYVPFDCNCEDEANLKFQLPNGDSMFIPSAFTPNYDSENDAFYFWFNKNSNPEQYLEGFHYSIYDKADKIIKEGLMYDNPWYGRTPYGNTVQKGCYRYNLYFYGSLFKAGNIKVVYDSNLESGDLDLNDIERECGCFAYSKTDVYLNCD